MTLPPMATCNVLLGPLDTVRALSVVFVCMVQDAKQGQQLDGRHRS
jgi:hypothetical protein